MPHYDFNLAIVVPICQSDEYPQGSTLVYKAWYDNSTNNPANPDPTKPVRWGEQTTEEMHFATLEYYID